MRYSRIVSLAPSNTETVFALGMGNRLVGVTEYCNYPQETKLIEKIGGFSTPNVENILPLSPDLVLAMDFHKSMGITEELVDRGIHCCLLSSESIFKAPQNIIEIGKILGCFEKALNLAKEIEQKMENILNTAALASNKVRVCYLCDIACTAWRSCHMSKLMEMLGGVNVARDIAESASEDAIIKEIIVQNPQLVLYSKGYDKSEELLSAVMERPEFKRTDACKKGNIYGLKAELICRPGPRAAEGLETLARLIHPEVFEPPPAHETLHKEEK